MASLLLSFCFSTLLSLLLPALAHAKDAANTIVEARGFVTRPDIQVPQWNLTVYDEDAIAPGYWFLAPYGKGSLSPESAPMNTPPMILDNAGQLVWSGVALTEGHSASDFRVSNVLGEDMLTFLFPHNRSFVVLDSSLNIFKQQEIFSEDSDSIYNAHELNFVNDGTRALFFTEKAKGATKTQSKDIGFNGTCTIRESTFKEADLLDDWRFVYRWSASKRIDLAESTITEGTIDQRCNETENGWDWVQGNSVDKFNREGDYLMSARYTNTIYRILRDGDIEWRLGGENSNFEADFAFSQPSHARILSYNDTHTTISFLDNGDREDGRAVPSRGLLVVLQTATLPMTATLLAEYAQPAGAGSHTEDDGSMQILPDGNVLLGWGDSLMLSEHAADGRLLMEAHVGEDWLKSYRTYKFPLVTQPKQAPDVYAEVYKDGKDQTVVYASWNGATEVTGWKVFRSTRDGKPVHGAPMTYVPRSGFETQLAIEGESPYVFVEAIDKDGAVIGRSQATQTIGLEPMPVDESEKQDGEDEDADADTPEQGDGRTWKETATSRGGVASFIGSLAIIAGIVLLLRYFWRRRRARASWASKHNRKPSNHELFDRENAMYAIDDEDEEEAAERYADKSSR